jgi:hypothetical protein
MKEKKPRIDLTLQKELIERLSLLAKLFNRSRSNQIEELIKAECLRWNIPLPEVGVDLPIPVKGKRLAIPTKKVAEYHAAHHSDRAKLNKIRRDDPRSKSG